MQLIMLTYANKSLICMNVRLRRQISIYITLKFLGDKTHLPLVGTFYGY